MGTHISVAEDPLSNSDDLDIFMEGLKAYGTLIFEYAGEGMLYLKDDGQISCQFKAGQLTDGEIILLCQWPQDSSD